MTTELREAISNAMGTETEVASPSPPEPVESPTPVEAPPAQETPALAPPPEPTPEAAKPQTTRDALGRFVPTKPHVQPEVAKQPEQAVLPKEHEKPPVAWSVTAKQEWDKLPPTIRAEVYRRETETAKVISQNAAAREHVSKLVNTVRPYMQAVQAETNGDVFAAIDGLMRTASTLRFGTPAEKAKTVAQLVGAYGIDIQMLDSALAGVAPQEQQGFNPQMIQQAVQQSLAPLLQEAQRHRQQIAQQTEQQVASELERFAADPKHEFFNDVRDLMADVMELSERRGVQLSLDDAYSQACRLHPEVSKVLGARTQAQSAQQLNAQAQRSRAAAVSVNGAAPRGTPPDGAEPTSMRAAIEAAIDSHSRV